MATPRERLIRLAASRLREHQARVALQRHGIEHRLAGRRVVYHAIQPRSRAMNELVEGAMQDLGGEVRSYYLNLSDRGYDRLEAAIFRRAKSRR